MRGEQTPFDSHRFELIRVQEETAAGGRPALLVLARQSAFLSLIACANVANSLLVRAARRREIAIRIALGAGRLRLIRQTLTDPCCSPPPAARAAFSSPSAVCGSFARSGRICRVDLRTGATFPRLLEVGVDRSVLLFALAASLVTGLLFGVVPALRLSREAPMHDLRGPRAGSRAGRARRRACAGHAAVCRRHAARSQLVKLAGVDPGHDPPICGVHTPYGGELVAPTNAQQNTGIAGVNANAYYAQPYIQQAAGYANQLPMVGLRDTAGGLWRTPDPSRPPPPIGPDARFVSHSYLSTMGIPVIAGRGFGEADGFGQPRVLLINQALASSDFPGENPIGQRVYIFRSADPWEIVGVVGNVRQFGLDRAAEPQFFVDVRQWPENGPPMFPGGAYYAARTTRTARRRSRHSPDCREVDARARSTTSPAWRASSPTRWGSLAVPCCSGSSPRSPSRSRPSGSGVVASRSRSARAKSASAWRWVQRAPMSWRSSCARSG